MNLRKIIIAGKTRNYTDLDAVEIAMAKKLGGGGGGSVTIVPWSTGTDEEIVAMLQAAHAGRINLQTDGGWAVGDVRTITVGAFTGDGNVDHAEQSIDIVISQFGNYMNCGCVMQFDFKDELAKGNRMAAENSNAGGYGALRMKTETLPAMVNVLPLWLKDSLIEFSVLASEGSQSDTIVTVTGNKLALRSEVEVLGTATKSKSGEGSQIDYYKTATNRIKKQGHSGSAYNWWLRSPCSNNTFQFCDINAQGQAASYAPSYAYGVAPFGCL